MEMNGILSNPIVFLLFEGWQYREIRETDTSLFSLPIPALPKV